MWEGLGGLEEGQEGQGGKNTEVEGIGEATWGGAGGAPSEGGA